MPRGLGSSLGSCLPRLLRYVRHFKIECACNLDWNPDCLEIFCWDGFVGASSSAPCSCWWWLWCPPSSRCGVCCINYCYRDFHWSLARPDAVSQRSQPSSAKAGPNTNYSLRHQTGSKPVNCKLYYTRRSEAGVGIASPLRGEAGQGHGSSFGLQRESNSGGGLRRRTRLMALL